MTRLNCKFAISCSIDVDRVLWKNIKTDQICNLAELENMSDIERRDFTLLDPSYIAWSGDNIEFGSISYEIVK